MLTKIAMIFWGFTTIVLAAASLGFILAAGQYLDADGKFSPDAPTFMPGMYFALKDNGSLVAAVLAASGLGWSYLLTRSSSMVP